MAKTAKPSRRSTGYKSVFWSGNSLRYRYIDQNDVRQDVLYGPGKPKDASRVQQDAEERVAKIRAGLIDEADEDRKLYFRRKPIQEVLVDFLDHQERVIKVGRNHIKELNRVINNSIERMNVKYLCDYSPTAFNNWLTTGGWSEGTQCIYAAHVRTMINWAVNFNFIDKNPSGCPVVRSAGRSEAGAPSSLHQSQTPQPAQAQTPRA